VTKWSYLIESDVEERELFRQYVSGSVTFETYVAKLIRLSKPKGLKALASKAARIRIHAMQEVDEVRDNLRSLTSLFNVVERMDYALILRATWTNHFNERRNYIVTDVGSGLGATGRFFSRSARSAIRCRYFERDGVSRTYQNIMNSFWGYKNRPLSPMHLATMRVSVMPISREQFVRRINARYGHSNPFGEG
jgi:hypothetical protein